MERIIPFDPVPRLIADDEWRPARTGTDPAASGRRTCSFTTFITSGKSFGTASCPELILGASSYRRECVGLRVPRDIYIHISGIDLIRGANGEYLVLEDNGRTPSGVSYVLKNRQVMKQVFPFLFEQYNVRPNDDYAANLLAMLHAIAPEGCEDPTVVVLTPGRTIPRTMSTVISRVRWASSWWKSGPLP